MGNIKSFHLLKSKQEAKHATYMLVNFQPWTSLTQPKGIYLFSCDMSLGVASDEDVKLHL